MIPAAGLLDFQPRDSLWRRVDDRVVHGKWITKWSDVNLSLGPLTGKSGTTGSITVRTSNRLRCEKLIAVDGTNPNGSGTSIAGITSNMQNVLPRGAAPMPTWSVAPGALSAGVDPFETFAGQEITFKIHFHKDCTFSGVIFGKAAVPVRAGLPGRTSSRRHK